MEEGGETEMKTINDARPGDSLIFDPDQVVALYDQGKRVTDIARICDRNPNVISAILTARGVGIRTRRVKTDGGRRITARGDEPEPYMIRDGHVTLYDNRAARMKRVDAAPARDAAAGRITLTEATRRMRISVKTLKRVMEKNGLSVTNCNRRK